MKAFQELSTFWIIGLGHGDTFQFSWAPYQHQLGDSTRVG
jgi:hypothetical protein